MNKSTYHIVIIGVGQIGLRHLQSLCKIERKTKITVVDPKNSSLKRAKIMCNKMPLNDCIQSVTYNKTIDSINSKIDLAIIATKSDVRRNIIENLLDTVAVDNFILEKFTFQSINDFNDISRLLKNRNIKAWVNCPRRMYPFYNALNKELVNKKAINMVIDGGNWDLACNSLHFVDLFYFITQKSRINIDHFLLDDVFTESKRSGFIEFTGRITFLSERGDRLTLISDKKGNRPVLISITGEDRRYHIIEYLNRTIESEGRVSISLKNNDWEWQSIYMETPLVSDLTHIAVQQILDKGSCQLPVEKESFKLQKQLLSIFISHLNSTLNEQNEICPIT